MLVNKFKMRDDVLSFNLGGMGCSASVISVDLVRRLLRSSENRNCLALVVSTENITQNWSARPPFLPVPTCPPFLPGPTCPRFLPVPTCPLYCEH